MIRVPRVYATRAYALSALLPLPPDQTMPRTSVVVLAALLCMSGSVFAADDNVPAHPTDAPTPEASVKKRALFPPLRRPNAEEPAESVEDVQPAEVADPNPPAEGPNVNTPAAESTEEGMATDNRPSEGIWQWVDRMEGEIPSDETVEAIEELEQLEQAERVLIDELAGSDVPVDLYTDPAAALTVDPLYLDRVDPSEFDIPVVVNDEVRKWVKYFTGSGRKYYAKWLGRSTRFRPMMYRELDAAGLPRDLVYLSMIESGYNAHAYSHASAAGLWQFIPSTARLYKMRVDWWVDDRRDPEASLDASIAFLSELHQMFGDWPRAWAAYNGGPGRIRRASSKADSKDFWVLARGTYLHPETDNYVPKIMAAAIIGHHPERYGFTDIDFQEELVYDVAHVDGSVELGILAKAAGTDLDTLKALNPALRRFATPPEGYDVRLPVGRKDTFVAALAKIPKDKRVTVAKHTVRRGETLSVIAGKYRVSVGSLSAANNLRNVNRIYVGMTLVIPVPGGAPPAVASSSSSSRSSSTPSTHTVRSGETLSSIATRYGTSVSSIKSRNGLSGSTIYVGQKLKLTGSSGGSSSAVASTYTVRRGDSLSGIASKHGVSLSSVQRANGISNASHIQVGQKLKIPAGSSAAWRTHTVKSGDSLGRIASVNGCSVSQLQSWNNLSGTTIHPGQQLRIRSQ